jgi:hypothetical protein
MTHSVSTIPVLPILQQSWKAMTISLLLVADNSEQETRQMFIHPDFTKLT